MCAIRCRDAQYVPHVRQHHCIKSDAMLHRAAGVRQRDGNRKWTVQPRLRLGSSALGDSERRRSANLSQSDLIDVDSRQMAEMVKDSSNLPEIGVLVCTDMIYRLESSLLSQILRLKRARERNCFALLFQREKSVHRFAVRDVYMQRSDKKFNF